MTEPGEGCKSVATTLNCVAKNAYCVVSSGPLIIVMHLHAIASVTACLTVPQSVEK